MELASSTQRHRTDRTTSSLGHVSVGWEYCVAAVAVFDLVLETKSEWWLSKLFFFGGGGRRRRRVRVTSPASLARYMASMSLLHDTQVLIGFGDAGGSASWSMTEKLSMITKRVVLDFDRLR